MYAYTRARRKNVKKVVARKSSTTSAFFYMSTSFLILCKRFHALFHKKLEKNTCKGF